MVKLPEIEEELYACNMCGYCVPVCPPYQEIGWESATPRGKVFYMKTVDQRSPLDLLLRRPTKLSRENGGALAKAVYECTSCGACEEVCHADIPFNRLWDRIKGWIVEEGFGPMPEHEYMLANVEKNHNLFGEPHEARDAWVDDEVRPSPSPDVLFWVGCQQSYRKQATAKAVVKILNAANVRYQILGKREWCCGSPLLRVGYGAFVRENLILRNIEAVAETGAKTLVTACAECYRTWLRDYRESGGNPPFRILHISQFIEELVRARRLRFSRREERKVTYHDACHMGRHCKEYQAPRTVMQYLQGVTLLEMFHTKEETLCSGAGGGFRDAFPKEADDIANRRLMEAQDAGAETIVTACPFAEAHFEEVAQRRGSRIKVLDLAELAAEHL